MQDSKNRAYNVTMTGIEGPTLDGEAGPGKSRRGVVDFEVDSDSAKLVLNFKGDMFSSGTATIKLS